MKLAPLMGFMVLLAACTGTRPPEMESLRDMLPRCPDKPNCVCSQYPDDKAHFIEPIAYADSTPAAVKRLKDVLTAMPRTRITQETTKYMHVEFSSLILRFVDDVQFHFPTKEKVIQVRSASRLGYGDFNVNRKRVEAIRAQMQK